MTVLFTDISGFTSLAEHLDPESLRAVMERYYGEMRGVVQRHGGTVEGFIGDAVMAVFGIPRLHEDDSLRAVRAAVEMRSTVAALNSGFEQDWGVTIEVHSGVNTGEVATGSTADALVLGDAVNVAARLQQLATRGEILIGPLTARLVRDVAQLESMGPVSVKGKSVPIDTFRLVNLDTTGAVRSGRRTTPVVGREQELEILRREWRAVRADQTCRLVTLTGPAGIGKTRLASEFTTSLEGEGDILKGQCVDYGGRTGLDPVAQMIRQAAGGVLEGAPAATVREELDRLLDGVEERLAIAEYALPVLGLGGTASGPDETAWAVRKLFEAAARRRPLVLVFEDLHWADPGLLDVIRHIRDWSQGAPLLLICLTRPELIEDGGWEDTAPNSSIVTLAPLSEADSSRLIESLVGDAPVSPRAMARITEAAQGNALYLEEVLSMLIDDGALRQVGDRWSLVQEHSSIATPPTIRALLAARIDRLPPDRRRILEIAAVVGASFSIQSLSALHDADEAGLRECLAWLAERDVIRELGDDSFQFAHALVRDAAYLGMTKETRAHLHEKLADWLSTGDSAVGIDVEALIGHHLEHAYRYLTELRPVDAYAIALAGRAGSALATTGTRAFESGEMPAAANALRRAVSLLPTDGTGNLSLYPVLSEALMNVGDLASAIAAVDEGLASARQIGERQVEARLTLIRSTHRLFTDPEGGAEALEEVQETIPRLEALGDDRGLAKAWHLLAMVDVAQSRFASAEQAMERAAWHAQRGGDRRQELEILSWLPLPIWIGPRPAEEGIRRYHEIVASAGLDRKVGAMVHSMRAALEGMAGDLAAATRSLALARAMFEDLGLRLLLAGSSQIAGFLALLSGDAAEADRELESGMRDLMGMGETGLFSTVAGLRAHALFELGSDDEAVKMANLSEDAAGQSDLFSIVLARSARAKVAARGGKLEEGESLARQAVSMARDTDSPQLIGDALLDSGRVLMMGRNPTQAVEAAREAIHQFERKGNVVSAGRARTLVVELGASVS